MVRGQRVGSASIKIYNLIFLYFDSFKLSSLELSKYTTEGGPLKPVNNS